MADRDFHWQERGTAWKGVGIYHVTLTVTSRQPLLGTLEIPNEDPAKAYIEEASFGKDLVQCVLHWHEHYPEIRVLQFCLMPDHLHIIVHVQRPMPRGIMTVVRGLWQAAKKLGRAYSVSQRLSLTGEYHSPLPSQGTSFTPNTIRDKEQTSSDPLFHEIPFLRPLVRQGQLDSMFEYLRMNPVRLATKRLMPEFFRVQDNITIAGQTYAGVGNAGLLQHSRYMPVHVRRTMVDEAMHSDDKRLRDYMNSCVLAARQGSVMVSPFISEYEKAVMDVLLKENLPFIYIADNGFRDYYKPSATIFDAVAKKQVLILSPWDYDPDKKHVSRADCVAMNKMAEDICAT